MKGLLAIPCFGAVAMGALLIADGMASLDFAARILLSRQSRPASQGIEIPAARSSLGAEADTSTLDAAPAALAVPPASRPSAALGSAVDGVDSVGPVPCDTQLWISALVYDPVDSRRSSVVLRSRTGSVAAVPGTRIGGRRLAAVYPHAIRLEDETASCWVGMFNERSRAKRARAGSQGGNRDARKAAPTVRERGTGAPFTRGELAAGVRRVGPSRYHVDRGLLDTAISRIASIAARVRFAPVRTPTGVRGVRLAKAPRHGLLSSLGLRRDDVLRSVNGYKLGRADEVMALYSSLQRASEFSVSLERDGAPAAIVYAVR